MVEIKGYIQELVKRAAREAGFEVETVVMEHPTEMSQGDLATPLAMQIAKREGLKPQTVAEKILENITKDEYVARVEAAGPGFINFWLSEQFFKESLAEIENQGKKFGWGGDLSGKRVMVEYTDPNPFKEFHIGHLMSNTIGEAISRLVEAEGAETRRVNYQGDVGMHAAKAIWGKLKGLGELSDGTAYAAGATAYKDDEEAKKEITEINKKIYSREDEEIDSLYEEGKKESLDKFEKIYGELGTRFDDYFFESETGEVGKKIVEENTPEVFQESEGAMIFKGEEVDSTLHTRVFLNAERLPTYEAKELGLLKVKNERWPFDESITVTGNEIDAYFRVVKKAMELTMPKLAEKVKHISHGMLRLPEGKMSSRTGKVKRAEDLIEQAKKKIEENIKEKIDGEIWKKVGEEVAVGAIKYSILRQSPGKDIIFDFEKSLSFEGDSGPYLQYTNARINSVLEQAEKAGIDMGTGEYFEVNELVRSLYRFPEAVKLARENYAPNYIATYLHEVASMFNAYYAENRIVGEEEFSPYRVALARVTGQVLKNGLWILGMAVPERM